MPWVTYSRVLGEFGKNETAARRAYRRFVDAGIEGDMENPLRDALHGIVLGSDDFVRKVQRLVSTRPDDGAVPALRALRPRPTIEQIIAATVLLQTELDKAP